MFSREFFLQFSWTGLTNDKNFPDGKKSFKDFKLAIDLFLSIVSNADNTYGIAENKSFFMSLMHRSKHRLDEDSGRKRKAPAPKRRPRKITYKRKKNSDGVVEEENKKEEAIEDKKNESDHDDETRGV